MRPLPLLRQYASVSALLRISHLLLNEGGPAVKLCSHPFFFLSLTLPILARARSLEPQQCCCRVVSLWCLQLGAPR